MDKLDNSATESQMKTLREGIKKKYEEYHSFNRDRFPAIEYNTNRTNYEPLRESFEEEFYVLRKINRTKNTIHVPSTNTLVLIFCDINYIPSKRILDTCCSYIESKPQVSVNTVVTATSQSKTGMSTRLVKIFLTGFLLIIGFVIYIGVAQHQSVSSASGLIIHRPSSGKIVPRELLATGEVSNADTVWIVVRTTQGLRYWVQPPIKVENDNTWRGVVYVGSDDKGDIGVRSQLRAFVNPVKPLKEGTIIYAWPEAQLSSEVTEVIRGSADEY